MNAPTLNTDRAIDESDSEPVAGWSDALIDRLGMSSAHVGLLTAWIATCGSLFFSEVLGWRPCVLCWYQRILMYPLALLLAIGILRRDRGLYIYVLPFSLTGIGVSLYHALLIKTDWFPPPACAIDVPCTVDYLNWFGFITIPFLALTAFVIITGMMLTCAWWQTAEADAEHEGLSDLRPATRIDTSTLAVGMIIVSVILVFLLGSTFV